MSIPSPCIDLQVISSVGLPGLNGNYVQCTSDKKMVKRTNANVVKRTRKQKLIPLYLEYK